MRNSCVSFVKSSVLLKKRIPLLASSPSSTSYIVVARNREDLTSPSLMDTVYRVLEQKGPSALLVSSHYLLQGHEAGGEMRRNSTCLCFFFC